MWDNLHEQTGHLTPNAQAITSNSTLRDKPATVKQ